eukprot:SAG11_NODE_7129_length_1189_cov_1.206422_2_plen_161_part_00
MIGCSLYTLVWLPLRKQARRRYIAAVAALFASRSTNMIEVAIGLQRPELDTPPVCHVRNKDVKNCVLVLFAARTRGGSPSSRCIVHCACQPRVLARTAMRRPKAAASVPSPCWVLDLTTTPGVETAAMAGGRWSLPSYPGRSTPNSANEGPKGFNHGWCH